MDKNKLEEIKQKALENHIPIIMDDTLEVIGKKLKENPPKRILEIGAAVGYSAMCFSEFLAEDGIIDTIERDEERYLEAIKNIKNFGLENRITLIFNDAFNVQIDKKFDLIFFDAAKAQNIHFFTYFEKNLEKHGTIITKVHHPSKKISISVIPIVLSPIITPIITKIIPHKIFFILFISISPIFILFMHSIVCNL